MKFILGFWLIYLMVGVIRTALTWKGNRAHIDGTSSANYFPPPWAHWCFCVAGWPAWRSDYHQWRVETKLIKLGERQNRARRSET